MKQPAPSPKPVAGKPALSEPPSVREPTHEYRVPATGVQAHDAVMAGMPGHALGYIVSMLNAVPRKTVLDAIGVSERTAHRIKANPDKPLDTQTSDAIFRLESVREAAVDVLGGVEAANEWLNTEAVGLEFRKPIELMSTSPGAEAVKTLLQRMKYGVYA